MGTLAGLLMAIFAGSTLMACGTASPTAQPSAPPASHRRTDSPPTSRPPTSFAGAAPQVPVTTEIATLRGSIPRFSSPGGPETGTVPATWYGSPSALPVVARRPGWLDVRLAQRPNESTAWVLASDVTLSTSPYAIEIDLTTRHLTLYHDAQTVFSAPAGVGTHADPTPTGQFFVALFASPPSRGYGAFVMVTSAHSNVITDWDHSGDAIVAIHGPLGSDTAIGTSGAAISHGCIRLHEPDLLRLRAVPVGSPVDIVT